MESDPLLLTWRAARPQHTVAAALAVGIGAPLCALALLCLRDLIAVLPRDEAPVLPFLRVAVQLPGGELVLVPGMPMRPAELELTAFLCIAVCALALAGVGWFVASLCFKAQNKAGDAVREGVLQAILNVVDFGMTMAEAVSAPRFSATSNAIDVTNRIPRWTTEPLEAMGYEVIRNPMSHYFGVVHGIRVTPDGRLEGGADPGRDGVAYGLHIG